MTKMPVYMDNNATTRTDPRVVEAMLPYFTEKYGNAASRNHPFGWEAEAAVEEGREQIAALLNASAKEVIFTSGATESNNLAIKGVAAMYKKKGNHVITQATEHKAVLDTCKRLERDGFQVTYLPVDQFGQIHAEQVREAMTDKTITGVVPILVTPFDDKGRIDTESLGQLIDFNIDAGVHGLGVALGSEIFKFSEVERDQVARAVVGSVRGRVPVIINSGANGTDLAVQYSRAAEAAGADALMVIPPHFFPASSEEIAHYYKTIDAAVGIPIIALNMVGSITDHVDLVVSDPVQAGTMAVMAGHDAADEPLAIETQEQFAVMDFAQEGDLTCRIVIGAQQPAGFPQLDHRGDVLVAAGADHQTHVSTGVSPGRPHSAQEPS